MSTDDNTFKRVQWDGDEPLPSDDDGPDGMPLQPPRGPGLSAADLELLTLAGRALGAVRVEIIDGESWVNLHFADGSTMWNWNSLLHCDDAFVLAARLRIDTDWTDDTRILADYTCSEPVGDDATAAARRAVTRAAAEIEKQRSS